MLLLKLTAPLLLLFAIMAKYVTDYVWHDKRTKWHKLARTVLVILQLTAGVGTLVVVVWEHKASEENREALGRMEKDNKDSAEASKERDTKSQTELTVLQDQVKALNKRLEPFVRIATSKYPSLTEGPALLKLADELADVRTRTSFLERRIYSFKTEVELVIQGEWTDKLSQGPDLSVVMPSDKYVKFIHIGADRGKDIACYPTSITRRREGQDRIVVNFEASVREGDWPIGQSVDEVRDYLNAEIVVANVSRQIAKSPTVIVREVRLKVFINGIPQVSRDYHLNYAMKLPEEVRGLGTFRMSGGDFLAEVSKKSQ